MALCDESPAHSRLVIDRLILTNFKSYAGVQEIGPFHRSFSAVVGPNGSGKSNVIDALLFVFGYRASKLRQPKAADLIHYSEASPNCESCSVQVLFQELQPAPSPPISIHIERIAHKNSKNEYLLNKKQSSFSQVTAFLREKGIDLDHHRFLILQGEVESIALMKPKATTDHEEGLLEYLEDMIGSYKYKPMIEQAFQAFEAASHEANQKLAHLRLLDQDLIAKRLVKDETEAYLQKENVLTVRQAEVCQISSFIAGQRIGQQQQQQQAIQAQLKVLEASIQSERAKLTAIEDADLLRTRAIAQLEQTGLSQAKQAHQTLERSCIAMHETRKQLRLKLSRHAKSCQVDKSTLSQKSQTLTSMEQEYESLHVRELPLLRSGLAPAEQELERLRGTLQGRTTQYQARVDQLQTMHLEPQQNALHKIMAKLTVCQTEHDMLSGKTVPDATVLAKLDAKHAELKGSQQQRQSSMDTAESDLRARKKEYDTMVGSKADLEQFIHETKQTIAQIRNQRASHQERLHVCATGSKILDALLNHASTSPLMQGSSVYGRLGDLYTMDEMYQTAMQSAAGSSMEHIVVDTVQTGQRCIDHIRDQGLGRATFIILEKIAHTVSNMPSASMMKLPSFASRLVDLITPAQECLRSAFLFVLRDTIVADTLEHANQVAFGTRGTRYRVVTLQGEIIDKSGTMTGGGQARSNPTGRGTTNARSKAVDASQLQANLTSLRKEIEKLDRDLFKQEQKRQEAANLLTECQANIGILESGIRSLEASIKKDQQELELISIQLQDLASKKEEEIRKRATPEQVSRLKTLSSLLMSELIPQKTAVEQKIHEIQDEIRQEEEHIMKIGGVEFRAQLTRVDCIKEQISTAESRISKLQIDIKCLRQTCETLQTSLARASQEQESTELEIKGLDARITSAEHEISVCQSKLESIEIQIADLVEEGKSSKEQGKQIGQCLQPLIASEEDLTRKEMAIAKQLQSMHIERKNHERVLQELALHVISTWSPPDNWRSLDVGEMLGSDDPSDAVKAKEKEIHSLQQELNSIQRPPCIAILEQYRHLEQEHRTATEHARQSGDQRDQCKDRWTELKKSRMDSFMHGFHIISSKLKQVYQMITMGGNAELELVDSMDPFSEGVLFSVMPPKKTWKNINNLSGGEKTLSSLSLVFALHHYKPTPIYVMDEIDAALDFQNVSIIAHYIQERTANDAQFIVISLRNDMFEMANSLVGVYKVQHCTRSIVYCPEKKPEAEERIPPGICVE